MKASDKVALALGAVGTWIYIGGVDSDLWGRALPWEPECFFLRSLVRKSAIMSMPAARSRQSREEERRDEVFAAWVRSGSLK